MEPRAMADQEGRPGRDFREESLPVEMHFHKGGPKLRQTARDLNLGRAPTKNRKTFLMGEQGNHSICTHVRKTTPAIKIAKPFAGGEGRRQEGTREKGTLPAKKSKRRL